MKIILILFLIILELSCTQNKQNATNKMLNNKNMKNSDTCIIPKEVTNFVSNEIVFLVAYISVDDVGYMANNIFSLSTSKVFTRISNTSSPKDHCLFNDEVEKYQTEIKEDNYNQFLKYLKNIYHSTTTTKYTTPEYLSVNGGSKTYIYLKTGNSGKWLCFEPESSDLVDEIQKEFDKIFS